MYTAMDITAEVFMKIGKLIRLTKYRQDSEVLVSINSIWSEFIFRDIKLARSLKQKGYEFTLIGQDIYDKVSNNGLPTQHYNYLLIITYMDNIINPSTHTAELQKALYKELTTDYTNIKYGSILYSSINKSHTSAGIFTYVSSQQYHSSTISLSSTLGDSLLYLNVNLPYLRFCCTNGVRICNIHSSALRPLNPKNTLNILIDTHMNGYLAEVVECRFII